MKSNGIQKKKIFLISFLLILSFNLKAQMQGTSINSTYIGEVGVGLGGANYFGDLNNHLGFQAVKGSGSLFFRYFFSDYFGGSFHASYAKLGYSDVYNKNDFEHTRNLSFNTSLLAFSLQGDFNFFKFVPGDYRYRITPFLSLGIGLFHFNPYALYQGDKYFLKDLGTEGQFSSDYPDRKPYKLWAMHFPLEFGVKYSLNQQWTLQLSAAYSFTSTDYLDDVSKTYAGPDAFTADHSQRGEAIMHLQDRSYVYGEPIGAKGVHRGDPKNRDQFVLVQVGVSFLLKNYRCPTY